MFFYTIKFLVKRLLSYFHTFLICSFNSKVRIGKGSVVYYRSHIIVSSCEGGAVIGRNTKFGCSSHSYHTGMPFYAKILVDGEDAHVIIGDNCRINGAYIHAIKQIQIGNNCVMAAGVHIIDSNGHLLISNDRTKGRDNPEPIVIGNNVWIGLNVIILKGSVIGDNSVVAAGSIVKGNFPSCSLIAGNPAQVVKQLNL